MNLESQFRKLEEGFAGEKVNTITSPALEEWLNEQEWSPKTKNNYVVTLRTFFDFCQKQKWCAVNPGEELEKTISEDKVAGILTVTECARLLKAAGRFPAILPAIAIQLFAGLRRSEVCALDWSEVTNDVIIVTAGKSKTRNRRVVDIQPVLAEWLAPYREINGRIFEKQADAFNAKFRQVIEEANRTGKEQTPPLPPISRSHNCLRHTCASMHLIQFGNEAYRAMQLGHQVDVVHRHYKGLISRGDSEVYWLLAARALRS